MKVNIKKFSPQISIGAAAAAAASAPLIALHYRETTAQQVVINNYIDGKSTPDSKYEGMEYQINGLPAIKMGEGNTLGNVWNKYLLHSEQSELWVENEKFLLQSSETSSSPTGILSEAFKRAKQKINENKRVTGEEIHKVCRESYQIKVITPEYDKLVRDVWRYCNVALSEKPSPIKTVKMRGDRRALQLKNRKRN